MAKKATLNLSNLVPRFARSTRTRPSAAIIAFPREKTRPHAGSKPINAEGNFSLKVRREIFGCGSKAARELPNHQPAQVTQAGEPEKSDRAIGNLVKPRRIGPQPEKPIAQHQQKRAFLLVGGMAPRAETQPGFEIVYDATPIIEMPL